VSKNRQTRAVKGVRSKRASPIELDARMTIVQAADLHRTLLARLAQGQAIVIDGTRVEEIDTAILQLLISLWRTGLERGVTCAWRGVSDTLRQTAELVGVTAMLHLPDVQSAHERDHVPA
jgi:anti-anti-sigma regulatory factor